VTSGYPGFVGDPEDEDMDILLETNLGSYFNPSANVGAWVEATDGLEFGLSVQLPIHVEDEEAQVAARMPSNPLFDDAEMRGDTVKGSFDLPLIVRSGARVVGHTWDAELDVVYERWSVFEEIPTDPLNLEIINAPGIGTIPVGAMSVPREFEDTLSVRLGGDYSMVPDVFTLRAGGFWEQSAVPTKTLTVLQVDMDKVGFGLGGTWGPSQGVDVDFGYTHIFYFTAEVTDSKMRQLNSTNPEGTTVIGNGTYEASADLLGVGVRVGF
jgi:long-subunit fatty acid transport protein